MVLKQVGRLCLVLAALRSPLAQAQQWPQWRGPEGNGVSREKNFLASWTSAQNITWKILLPGKSSSTPIVWDGAIFLCSPAGDQNHVLCLQRSNGKKLWEAAVGPAESGRHPKTNSTTPSPVTDGERVYAQFGNGDLVCLDSAKGKEIWRCNLQQDLGRYQFDFGLGSSPLLCRDLLIIACLHGGTSYVLALDKKTGKVQWKTLRDTDAPGESKIAYSTPTLLESSGEAVAIVTGADLVTGYDAKTGQELWRSHGINPDRAGNFRAVSSPVAGGDLIFVPFPRGRSLLALKAGGKGDVSQSHRAWLYTGNAPDVPTAALADDRLYLCRDNGLVTCLDARTGEALWSGRVSGNFSASPVVADGKLYVLNEKGTTTVLEAGNEFKVLSENPLDEYCLASPALSRGQIFIRTEKTLYCIGRRSD